MEWLFLLLFYALSVYLKKKQQKAAHKEIEDDPDWDPEEKPGNVKPVDLLGKFLASQGLIEQETIAKRKDSFSEQEAVSEISELEDRIEFDPIPEKQEIPVPEDVEFIKRSKIERRVKKRRSIDLDHKIFHSFKRKHVKLIELLQSRNSLKQGIIIKEILDKPLSMRRIR